MSLCINYPVMFSSLRIVIFLLIFDSFPKTQMQNCSSSDFTAGQNSYQCTLCFQGGVWTNCWKTDCNYNWDTLSCEGGSSTNLSNSQCLSQCCPGKLVDNFTQTIWSKCQQMFTADSIRSHNGKIIGIIIVSIFSAIFLGLAIWIIFCYSKKNKQQALVEQQQEIKQDVRRQTLYLQQILSNKTFSIQQDKNLQIQLSPVQ